MTTMSSSSAIVAAARIKCSNGSLVISRPESLAYLRPDAEPLSLGARLELLSAQAGRNGLRMPCSGVLARGRPSHSTF
jgi:hypothetical protein